MLALPEMDVLDALGCDVVSIFWGVTNVFEQPGKWHSYDFNTRLPAYVRNPNQFINQKDGSVFQPQFDIIMPPSASVFDAKHGGQPLDLSAELSKPDLERVRKEQETTLPTDSQIKDTVDLCKRVRNSTDKAVFFNGSINTGIAITSPGGLAVWPMICLTDPDFVAEYHSLMTEFAIKRIELLLPEIAPYVDIIMMASDDWGTQHSLMAPPGIFEKLFLPYLQEINAKSKRIAPDVKLFLHSCGAVYDIIDLIIDSGFDILNPIQWTAGDYSYMQWKDKCRNRIAMWGGGVNTQSTLPLKSLDDVITEVKNVTQYFQKDNGYVFNAIHNILADTDLEKIVAMYKNVD
jgi:uroporphyrinogen decarboxylase